MPLQRATVVIAGGGFAGIRVALDLAKKKVEGLAIVLISERPDFEYQPWLYTVVGGHSPLGVRIPLREIVGKKSVKLVRDTIVDIDLDRRVVIGASRSHYAFDILVLAIGSEVAYYGVSGLKESAFALKSVADAARLNEHVRELITSMKAAAKTEQIPAGHIVIIGGGPTGAELAGELASYTRELARARRVQPSLITIDLIDSGPRLIRHLPEDMSARAETRLRMLGVNLFLNRTVVKEDLEKVYLKDMQLKTKTVIWAAGVRPHQLSSEITGLLLDEEGRVSVDEFMQAKGVRDVFAIGDVAVTEDWGLAQTAIAHARYVADVIARRHRGEPVPPYKRRNPSYAIALGHSWAAVLIGRVKLYGRVGWWLRLLADLRFFLSVLPVWTALAAFLEKRQLDPAADGS